MTTTDRAPKGGAPRALARIQPPTRKEIVVRSLTGGPLGVIGIISAGCVATTVALAPLIAAETVGGAAAALLAIIAYPSLRGARREIVAERVDARNEVVTRARDALESNLENLLFPNILKPQILTKLDGWEVRRETLALVRDADAAAECNDIAVRVMALKRYRDEALREIGPEGGRDAEDINQHAAEAAEALYSELRRTVEVKRSQHRTHATETAPRVASDFARKVRRLVGDAAFTARTPPSTSASAARLIAVAEQALSHDPDLTDGTGARVDDLVRLHLPRLLRRHGEAAGAASSEDLAGIDADLAEGVEQARASIDEALAGDAERRFDALREEVAFLRSRRGIGTGLDGTGTGAATRTDRAS